jgi:hypothetical protein
LRFELMGKPVSHLTWTEARSVMSSSPWPVSLSIP